MSRKDARREQRQSVKQRKANHSSTRASHASPPVAIEATPRSVELKRVVVNTEHLEAPPKKKVKFDDTVPVQTSSRIISKPPKTLTALQKLSSISIHKAEAKAKPVVIPRTNQDKTEDAYIAYLEKQLGYGSRSRSKKKNAEDEDGLDGMSTCYTSLSMTYQTPAHRSVGFRLRDITYE